MQAKELRDLDDAELAKQVAALRQDLFGLRFANATTSATEFTGNDLLATSATGCVATMLMPTKSLSVS